MTSVPLSVAGARRRVYALPRPTRDLRKGTPSKTVWGEELVDEFWSQNPAYPGPRPRSIADRIAAGLLSPEAAASITSTLQYRARPFTFFLRFATAGYAVVASPAFRGPALIKSVNFTHMIDGAGQPSEIVIYKSLDNTGTGGFGAGSYAPTTADENIFTMARADFGLTFTRANFLPSTGVGTSQQMPMARLDRLVTDDIWYLKVEFESPNVGTNELGGLILVYESIQLDQLAQLLG